MEDFDPKDFYYGNPQANAQANPQGTTFVTDDGGHHPGAPQPNSQSSVAPQAPAVGQQCPPLPDPNAVHVHQQLLGNPPNVGPGPGGGQMQGPAVPLGARYQHSGQFPNQYPPQYYAGAWENAGGGGLQSALLTPNSNPALHTAPAHPHGDYTNSQQSQLSPQGDLPQTAGYPLSTDPNLVMVSTGFLKQRLPSDLLTLVEKHSATLSRSPGDVAPSASNLDAMRSATQWLQIRKGIYLNLCLHDLSLSSVPSHAMILIPRP
jgi:hypothetical protein